MKLYDKWLKKEPINPLYDFMEFKKNPREFKKFLSCLNHDSIKEDWNIFSIILCWDCPNEKKKEVIKEIVLAGGDMNIHGHLGITALHTLLIRIMYCSEDLEMFIHLLKIGLNIKSLAFINPRFDIEQKCAYTPLEFIYFIKENYEIISLLSNSISKHNHNDIYIEKLITFFSNPEESFLEYDIKLHNYKLCNNLYLDEVKNRVRFIQRYKNDIDFEEIRKKRKEIYFKESDDNDVYVNGLLADVNEFMPYEFLNYKDGAKYFYFHKNVVHSIFKRGINPLTNIVIPREILSKWYDDLQNDLYCPGISTLEDILFPNIQPISEDDEVIYYIYDNILHSHPYNNVIHISKFTIDEIRYISFFLTQPPFRYKMFLEQIRTKHNFTNICLSYLMENKNNNFIHHFHFALEETIQDLKMLKKFKSICEKNNISFEKKNFDHVCKNIYEIYDLLFERIGLFDNFSFRTIWNRLVYYDNHISSSPSKSLSSSSSSSSSCSVVDSSSSSKIKSSSS